MQQIALFPPNLAQSYTFSLITIPIRVTGMLTMLPLGVGHIYSRICYNLHII